MKKKMEGTGDRQSVARCATAVVGEGAGRVTSCLQGGWGYKLYRLTAENMWKFNCKIRHSDLFRDSKSVLYENA
jgi:hypothetical protein